MKNAEELIKELKEIVYNLNSQEEDFLFFVEQHEQELLEKYPILYIGFKVDYYLQRDDLISGLEVINSFKNGKYISMEVEEFLENLKQEINKNINPKVKEMSELQIEKSLFSNDEYKMANAIRYLSTKNIRNYLPLIHKFLKQIKNENMHRLLLLMLVEQKVDEEFIFFLNGKENKIKPSGLKLPFDNDNYNLEKAYISSLNKDPSTCSRKIDIYSSILVKAYPLNPFDNFTIDKIYKYIDALDKEICFLPIDDSTLDLSFIKKLKELL